MAHRAHIRDKDYEEYSMQVHKKKIKNMKPAIDNKEPLTFSHLQSQRKRIQMESGTTNYRMCWLSKALCRQTKQDRKRKCTAFKEDERNC
jgi:hypothetical protein